MESENADECLEKLVASDEIIDAVASVPAKEKLSILESENAEHLVRLAFSDELNAAASVPAKEVQAESESQSQTSVEIQEAYTDEQETQKEDTVSLKCSVKGCIFSLDESERLKQGHKGSVQRWYTFPVNDPSWKEWVKSLGLEATSLSNVYICDLHFSEQQVANITTEQKLAGDNRAQTAPITQQSARNSQLYGQFKLDKPKQPRTRSHRYKCNADDNRAQTAPPITQKAACNAQFKDKRKRPRSRPHRYKCSVDGCPLNLTTRRRRIRGYNDNIHFFRFPSDKERCKNWISLLDLDDFIASKKKTLATLNQTSYRVCELHFLFRDIRYGSLNRRALPEKGILRPVPMADGKPYIYTGIQSDSSSDESIPETSVDIDNIIDNVPDIDNIIDNPDTSRSNISNVNNHVSDDNGILSSDGDDGFRDDQFGDDCQDDGYRDDCQDDGYRDDCQDDNDLEMPDNHTVSSDINNISVNANTSPSCNTTSIDCGTPSCNTTSIDCSTPSCNTTSNTCTLNTTYRTNDTYSMSAPTQVMLLKASVSKTGLLNVPGLKDRLHVVGGNYPLSAIQSGNLVLALPCQIDKENPQAMAAAAAAGATMCIPPLQSEINKINAVLPTCALSASSLLQTREVASNGKKLKVIGRTTGPGGRSALIATAEDCDSSTDASRQKNSEGGYINTPGSSYTVIPPDTVIPIKICQLTDMTSNSPVPSTQPVQSTQPDSSSQAIASLKKLKKNTSTSEYIDLLETGVGSIKADLKVVRKERNDLRQRVERMAKDRAERDESWKKKISAEQEKWKQEVEDLKSQVQKLAKSLDQTKEKEIV